MCKIPVYLKVVLNLFYAIQNYKIAHYDRITVVVLTLSLAQLPSGNFIILLYRMPDSFAHRWETSWNFGK